MNIYVGNVPYSVEEEDLQQAFGNFGEVTSVKVIKDRETGRSKGFGFVEMANAAEAEEAIANLNGSELDGRKMVVSEARPRPERRGGFGGGAGRGGRRF